MYRNNMFKESAIKIIISALSIAMLSGCGRATEASENQQPSTEVEATEPLTDNQEPIIPVDIVDDENNNTDSSQDVEETPVVENPTLVQLNDYEYTMYVNCPDNSTAPELTFISDHDTLQALPGSAGSAGISTNLLNAVMTHGMQVDPMNAGQINYDAYLDKTFDICYDVIGVRTTVLTNNPSNYGDEVRVYTMDGIKYDSIDLIPRDTYNITALLLKDAISNTNGNITCALARYNMGPDSWDQVMEECMNATGLSAELIYANCDSSFVLSYDTLGLSNPDYVKEVLQYIASDDPIYVIYRDENGDYYNSFDYYIDRAAIDK